MYHAACILYHAPPAPCSLHPAPCTLQGTEPLSSLLGVSSSEELARLLGSAAQTHTLVLTHNISLASGWPTGGVNLTGPSVAITGLPGAVTVLDLAHQVGWLSHSSGVGWGGM